MGYKSRVLVPISFLTPGRGGKVPFAGRGCVMVPKLMLILAPSPLGLPFISLIVFFLKGVLFTGNSRRPWYGSGGGKGTQNFLKKTVCLRV